MAPRPGPTQQPAGSSAGMPQTKQPTGWEHSPTHQQTAPLNTPLDTALPNRGKRPSCNDQVGRHQSLSPGNLHKPLDQPYPPGGRHQKQEELQTCSLRNDQKHRKLDRMRRQRNMSQMKEQDKIREQLSEMEISNLPEKEFRIMIVKMIQDLRKRMEAQTEKIQEIFNS